MVHGIFLSFRKDDPQLLRERVYEALIGRFGRSHVFKAGESIPPGAAYPQSLIQEAGACEIMLVLIGPAWLGAVGADGTRSIVHEQDWVRREVSEALRRGRRVVPVLTGDGQMLPSPEHLPEDIRELIEHQCLRVPDTGTDAALLEVIDRLIWILPALGKLAPDAPETPPSEPPVPPAAPAHQSIHGDHGTNFDNSGGTIRTGKGSVTIGGDHSRSTTIHKKKKAAAAEITSLAALWAALLNFGRKTRAWLQSHRWAAIGTGAGLVTAAGITTLALLAPSTSQAQAAAGTPTTTQTSTEPTTPTTEAAPTQNTATEADTSASAALVTGVSKQTGAIPAAGTDVLTLQDGNENSWTETFSFGPPVNGADADQGVVDYVAGCLPSQDDVPTETAVIPVQVTYDLTSAEPINNFGAGINASSNLLALVVYQYADGSYGCYSPSGADADIQFDLLRPNTPDTIKAWILIVGAYNGRGRPNTSQFAGTSVGGSLTSAASGSTVLSATGPDVCGIGRGEEFLTGGVLATGVKPSGGCSTS